jgi:hypothetical protein
VARRREDAERKDEVEDERTSRESIAEQCHVPWAPARQRRASKPYCKSDLTLFNLNGSSKQGLS